MAKISNEAELKASIRELELRTTQQEKVLKENAQSTLKSFQPANLVKVGLINAQKVAMSRDVRVVALNTFIGFAAGYITRKFIIGKNSNIFKRTLGIVVQTAITKMVYKNIPAVQKKTSQFISNYKRRSNHVDKMISD
jgi:uncharacterized membrane protein YjjP (DUF1212 family)